MEPTATLQAPSYARNTESGEYSNFFLFFLKEGVSGTLKAVDKLNL